jgi:hypothetical protein
VGEDVGAAAVLLDEAEALFRVEPLHGASSHVISPSEAVSEITLREFRVAVLISPSEMNLLATTPATEIDSSTLRSAVRG